MQKKPLLFTVNGERHCGTTFLKEILLCNNLDVFDGFKSGAICSMWKHGFASNYLKKLNIYGCVNIFIFRNIEDWLISMFFNPYHLYYQEDFNEFLVCSQKSCAHPGSKDEIINIRNKKAINKFDEGKNIFEIRQAKNKSYIDFFCRNENVVLVSLDYLKNPDNCLKFLKDLNSKYNIGMDENNLVCEIPYNVKTGFENNKSTHYNFKIDGIGKLIIDSLKNDEYENFIDNLTYLIKTQ